jgi:hypothetical protein
MVTRPLVIGWPPGVRTLAVNWSAWPTVGVAVAGTIRTTGTTATTSVVVPLEASQVEEAGWKLARIVSGPLAAKLVVQLAVALPVDPVPLDPAPRGTAEHRTVLAPAASTALKVTVPLGAWLPVALTVACTPMGDAGR